MRRPVREPLAHARGSAWCLALLACLSAGHPSSGAAEVRERVDVDVRTARASAIYSAGQRATFLFRVRRGGQPLRGVSVEVRFLSGGDRPLGAPVQVRLDRAGRGRASASLSAPGFLTCRVTYPPGPGGTVRAASAGFSPEQIRPVGEAPEGFDAFWQAARTDLSRVPIDPRLTAAPQYSSRRARAYKVSLANVGGTRMYGWLTVPRRSGPHPALLLLPRARGASRTAPESVSGAADALILKISIHDVDVDRPQAEYDEANAGPLKSYFWQGRAAPESYYFRRVLLGCVRALDYLAARPDWDGRHLAVAGASQGGGLALMTAGLDARVTAVSAAIPAFCDAAAWGAGGASSWPHLVRTAPEGEVQEAMRTAGFYDASVFAGRFRGDALLSAGFLDDTCPPDTVYSAYSALPGPRQIVRSPRLGHWVSEGFQRRQAAFLTEHFRP